jgi:hypothetical protein
MTPEFLEAEGAVRTREEVDATVMILFSMLANTSQERSMRRVMGRGYRRGAEFANPGHSS